HGTILGRQRSDRSLHVAHRTEVFFDARLILAPELCFHLLGVLLHDVQNAFLAIHPSSLSHTEQPVEELMRQHFRRQGPVAIGPAQIALNAFAEGFLRYADLQGAEARFLSQFPRDYLIDRRAARSTSGERLA